MNRLIAFALFLASTCAFAQVTLPSKYRVAAPKPTQAVGKANGKAILASDVEPYLWEWFGKDALYDVMSYLIVTQDAARRGVVISDAEVEKGIADEIKTIQKNQSGTPEQASATLKDRGFTRSRLFLRIKATLLMDKMILADFHPESYVKVSTILIRTTSADINSVSEAIKKSQAAYDRLKGGEDWTKVFSSVTTDQKLAATKGSLGWRALSLFPDSVQKEIMTLKPGEFTHPAQTEFGIQIFRLDAHGTDSKGDDLSVLKNSYLMGERARYMTDLKARSNAQVLIK